MRKIRGIYGFLRTSWVLISMPMALVVVQPPRRGYKQEPKADGCADWSSVPSENQERAPNGSESNADIRDPSRVYLSQQEPFSFQDY